MSDTPATPARKPETLRELGYLFTFLRPYRFAFRGAAAASLVSMAFGATFPLLLRYLIDAALMVEDRPLLLGHVPTVDGVAMLLVATLVIQAALTFFSSQTFNRVGERAVVDVRNQLFSRIVALPMNFFSTHRVGELTSRLSSDLAQIQEMFAFLVPQTIRQTMLALTGVTAMVWTSPQLAGVMLISVPPVVLGALFFGKRVRKASKEAQDRLAEAATIVEETLHNIASVKAYTNEQFESRRYGSALDRFMAVVIPAARLRAGLIAFIIAGFFSSIILVMWWGARLLQAGKLTHGQLTQFTIYTFFIGGAVASFADIFSTLNRTLGASERVRELFREDPELLADSSHHAPRDERSALDPGTASNAHESVGGARTGLVTRSVTATIATRLTGEVRMDAVKFRYPSRPDLPVLDGLTLSAAPGEQIALVGPSGAGKSTIAALLLRFYEPQEGAVLLDGRAAAGYDLAHLRENFAIVPQEVLLFGGTVRENIAYGR
ncbi:MAG TPA: ABC transporter transmembrane domain-containing protein, partial [Chthoniobacteraceae bacterium]|nr:ABC transporter transmembrane domain-containing protein [Chthoniobacteraceae bacterium]